MEFRQQGESRRHGQGVARERARLVHRAFGGQVGHDFTTGCERPHREPAADDFAEAHHVGRDAIDFGRASGRQPEAGHDFVEDEQRAVCGAGGFQAFQESGLRRDAPHVAGDRFHDDRGDLTVVFLE